MDINLKKIEKYLKFWTIICGVTCVENVWLGPQWADVSTSDHPNQSSVHLKIGNQINTNCTGINLHFFQFE